MSDRHANRERCGAIKDDGNSCRSTALLDDGHCLAHSEHGGSEVMRENARRGGLARALNTRGPEGFEEEQLPPLESMEEAMERLDLVGRAVLTGRIDREMADPAIRAVEAWVRTRTEHLAETDLREMRDALEQARDRAA